MPASKIVDRGEVRRWILDGRTYAWMAQEYARKYNVDVRPTMFSNFRRREGLARRSVRDDELIPWHVKTEHRWAYPVVMLRTEARRRAKNELDDVEATRLEGWLAKLAENDEVVHYDPDTEQGFFYVPRRPNIDRGLIREPERKTKLRRGDED